MKTVDTAIGLDFFLELSADRKSGYKPRDADFGGELFCDLRVEGFAALLRIDFAKQLVLTGANETYLEAPAFNRGWATRQMLIEDFGSDPAHILYMECPPHLVGTTANATAIAGWLEETGSNPQTCAVVSSHYHLPRTSLILAAVGIQLPLYPAEAFLLVENMERKNEIVSRLGGGAFAKRTGEELQGIAHIINETYMPRI